MLRRSLASVLLLIAGVQSASAEWTFAAFAGLARTQDSSIRLLQPSEATDVAVTPVTYRSESFEPPIYYGYRVGFFPGARWLGIEGEFVHLKVVADTARPITIDGVFREVRVSGTHPLATVIERFSISHGVNLVLLNAVARRAVGEYQSQPRWFLTGRIGAGASVPHPESTIAGASLEQYEWGSFSMQAAAGAELRLTRRIYLASEYKLTRTVQDVSVVLGSVRTPLVTHHLVTGILIHVGAFPR